MAIEEALIAQLSSVAGGRVHWGWAEGLSPAEGPYVRLTWISGPRDYTMAGPTRYARRRLQLDVFGLTFSAVRSAADATRAALSGFRGNIGSVRIDGIFIDNESTGQESDAGNRSGAEVVNYLHRHRMDLMVHYIE